MSKGVLKVMKGVLKASEVGLTCEEVVWKAGWDKTFYFVGANAFRQKFCPKQQESDVTKILKDTGNLTLKGLILFMNLSTSLFASFISLNIFSLVELLLLICNSKESFWRYNFFWEMIYFM